MLYFNQLKLTKAMLLSVVAVMATGCVTDGDDESVTDFTHFAVISTASGGEDNSGDISIISLADFSVDNENFAGGSDTVISTHGEHIYRIGRFQQDNVTKLSINSPSEVIWQYSANEEGGNPANPYKLVVKNDVTGYLIRYGSDKVWIVDPSATSHEMFKTGEIDLSAYGFSDGIPEVADALLIDDKLYLMMQNLDRDNGWTPGQAYMAVYDTFDNTEIETNSDASTPLGIALKGENPLKMEYLATTDSIYIAANGPFSGDVLFTGGLEAVDLNNYTSEIIIDDGDMDNHPYGSINNIAILNSTRGYFVGYFAYQNNAVFGFNPITGEVDPVPLMEHLDISDIEIGPLGNLWVTDRAASGITVINTVDETVLVELIDTDLVPVDIEFISRAE